MTGPPRRFPHRRTQTWQRTMTDRHDATTSPSAPAAPSADRTTLAEMIGWIRRYTDERDWARFHNPKDLGVALAIEVGEVLEHFRYRTDGEIAAVVGEPSSRRELGHELADCLWMLLRLADVTGVDLAAALREKMDLAALKYPADLVRGKAHKYTWYRTPGGDAGSGK